VRAVICPEPGGPEVLQLSDVPDPVAGSGEVVIDVVGAGVNRADLLQRQGRYPPPAGASPYLGLECSGRVSAVGESVEGWPIGAEVCALLAGGGYAERVAVPVGQLLPVPRGVELVDAAALPEAACTVWSNLVMRAHLAPGETVLVHGGGSGIGTMAIQVARLLGAVPFVTVGSDRKAEACRALGAEGVVNYHERDFAEAVLQMTDGRGVDVVLDIIGARYLPSNLGVLASGGRLAVIGLQGGVAGEIDLERLLTKRLTLMGSTLRSRSAEDKAAIVTSVRDGLWPYIGSGGVGSGRVHPVIDRVLPWHQVAEAHSLLERGDSIGKVLLEVSSV